MYLGLPRRTNLLDGRNPTVQGVATSNDNLETINVMDSMNESDSREAGTASRGDVNVIVMSDSGKPIFCLHHRDEIAVSRICGLIQAVRTSIHCIVSDFEEIQSVQSGSMYMAIMVVGAITLVAISTTRDDSPQCETEANLRLQLEYVYAQIVLTLTDQVQSVFVKNASFDLRSMLGNGDSAIRAILQEAGPEGNPESFLTAGIQTVFPLSHAARNRASVVLKQSGDETINTVAALLFVGNKLVTLVQSSYRPHQLKTADMYLLLTFVNRQQLQSELWLPLCLPRFNSSGFLYCYAHCLDAASKLTLALISQDGSTEQFQIFRAAAVRIRRRLGISVETGNILEILHHTSADSESGVDGESSNDVQWKRNAEPTDNTDNYEDFGSYEMIPYEAADSEHGGPCQLLPELMLIDEVAIDLKYEEYLDVGVLHFVFRTDVPILEDRKKKSSKGRNHQHIGHLTQCISPSLGGPFVDAPSKRRVWNVYQRLHLRLRLGSANAESIHDAFRMITDDLGDSTTNEAKTITPTIGKYCPAMGLAEAPPNNQGLTHLTLGGETYLAMNGRGFEM